MARRRGKGGGTPTVDQDLGVGALAGDLAHGERSIVESVVDATPSPGGGPPPAARETGGGPRPAGGGGPPESIFGPTRRTDEPPTAGVPFGPGPDGLIDPDPVAEIRGVYAHHPSPALLRLIDRADQRAQRG